MGNRLPYDDCLDPKPVVIGRNFWIGMGVCIVLGDNNWRWSHNRNGSSSIW
ncbi:hypothetical protein PITCH_A1260063 [uncultured Desulfobacterium sp.]|uniref:Uncharacterized protein n=1 Tax=uncultured Desulfobacterium sp. TaxID=201089 RepID=A0A445MRZ0_9BACT|nr:hypothetical protein PITCH_A1260063 [uncultured Desulfobacterium sp.]